MEAVVDRKRQICSLFRVREPSIHLLNDLASLEAQRRYVIGATVDEYLLPDELVGNAWHFCERAERLETQWGLTETQREAIARLKEAIDRLGACVDLYDRSNIADLIEHDRSWAVMRNRAGETLEAVGNSVPA